MHQEGLAHRRGVLCPPGQQGRLGGSPYPTVKGQGDTNPAAALRLPFDKGEEWKISYRRVSRM